MFPQLLGAAEHAPRWFHNAMKGLFGFQMTLLSAIRFYMQIDVHARIGEEKQKCALFCLLAFSPRLHDHEPHLNAKV